MSPSPEARRERLSADQRREQLMSAAVEILGSHGYSAATADEIARRAGVSKGLVWHYFADLDELFELSAKRTLTILAHAAAAAIDLEAPAPDVIRSAIRATTSLRLTHRTERRAIREIILNLRGPGGQPRFDLTDLDGLYSAQAAIFRRGQDEGDFRDDLDPRLLAVTYQGAVDAMLGYLDAYPESDAERHADAVAEILLGGIARRGRASADVVAP